MTRARELWALAALNFVGVGEEEEGEAFAAADPKARGVELGSVASSVPEPGIAPAVPTGRAWSEAREPPGAAAPALDACCEGGEETPEAAAAAAR